MTTPRLLFLIPYFGRWPFWMPFFLQSCRFNPDVQWLFFTDCGTPPTGTVSAVRPHDLPGALTEFGEGFLRQRLICGQVEQPTSSSDYRQ